MATGPLAVLTDLAIYALYVGIFLAPVEQLINFTGPCRRGCQVSAASSKIAGRAARRGSQTRRALAGSLPAAARCAALDYRDATFSTAPIGARQAHAFITGTSVALIEALGRRQDHHLLASAALLRDVAGGASTIDGVDVRDVSLANLRDAIGIDATRTMYLFGGTVGRTSPTARPGATQAEIEEAARRNPSIHESSSARCPTATTRSWASAARSIPGGQSSASPSRACSCAIAHPHSGQGHERP